MQTFFLYWYTKSPNWFYTSYLNLFQLLDGQLAVKATFKNLGKPIFQDYSWQGRIIGFSLRLVRICLASLLYLGLAIGYFCLFILWLLFPFICLVSLIGSVFGPSSL